MDKCCLYCRWFDSGKCCRPKTFKNFNTLDVDYLAEQGLISGAIQDAFCNCDAFPKLHDILETKFSKKRTHEIMTILFEELDENIINWVENIDSYITRLLKNELLQAEQNFVEIVEPDEFVCKYFR